MVIDETGGSHGVRDHSIVISAEQLPQQRAFGKELYPTVFIKAAVYARNIITAHPFVDGNKRTGMAATSVFIENNGYKIEVVEGGVEKFAIAIIKNRIELEDIAQWFKENSRKIKIVSKKKNK